MKFAAKIGLTVIIAALIVTPLLGVAIFLDARAVVERSIIKDIATHTETLMRDIDHTLYLAHRDIRMIASSELLEDVLATPRAGEKEAPPETRDLTRWLSEMTQLTGPWEALAVFDGDGGARATSGPIGKCAHVLECPQSAAAFEAAKKGRVYYSDLVVSDITGRPTVVFAAPILREPKRDAVVGVAVGHFAWGVVLQILDRPEAGFINAIHLFNRDGLTIATPTAYRDHILKMRVAGIGQSESDPAAAGGQYSSNSTPTHHGEGEMLAARVMQEGLYDYLGSGWGLQMEVPRERAFAPVRRIAWNTAFLIMAALAFLAAMLAIVGGRFIRPLTELAQAARQIGMGKLDKRVAVRTNDEIGDVARSLNAMAENLAQTLVTKKEAETANRAKSDFLSSMSHELRTPMNAILGFAQLLKLDPQEPHRENQDSWVENILASGQHLLELIDQVLELSKIEAGVFALTIEHVLVRDVLDESLAMVEGRAAERDIEIIDQTAPDDLSAVRTDATRLMQVLLNLLSNAVKYNRHGGQVTLSRRDAADGMVRIVVADSGEGIPKDRQCDLFKPFKRLGREPREIEGTGIGLTITKQIVEMLGGRIGFESEEGKGSTFWVDIPASTKQAAEDRKAGAAGKGVMTVGGENEAALHRSVLYIEDNPANMRLMEAIIEGVTNTTLLSAHNAELGLELTRKYRPDLILMDVNLPGMDGMEALEEIKRNPDTSAIPVIALTALAMPVDVRAGLKAGFDGYLTKPIDVQEVLKAIDDAIAARPPRDAPGGT